MAKEQQDTDLPVFGEQDFTRPYAWQLDAWRKLTSQPESISHALLLAGAKGTGKLGFAHKLAAWLLCRDAQADHACGQCTSCQWLKAGTHPQFLNIKVAAGSKSDTIKVDDVRGILPFASQSSAGMRVVLINKAELMNVSAANALLKTLEEPPAGVHFLLTSNNASLLLPTIKSRTQALMVAQVSQAEGAVFLQQHGIAQEEASELLGLAGGAPLAALELKNQSWYAHRQTWIKVWQAMRSGQRSHLAASGFWQKQLSLADALALHEAVCTDLQARVLDMPTKQQLGFELLKPAINTSSLQQLVDLGQQLKGQSKQNVGVAYAMDKLMLDLSLA